MNDEQKNQLAQVYLPHLRKQFEQARPILFTGAGFSYGAKNYSGQKIPLASEITREIWKLCFPTEEFEPDTSLQNLYEHALIRHKRSLTDLLWDAYRVDSNTLPKYYAKYYSLPWSKIYTLNIDDLDKAVSRMTKLSRPIVSISATRMLSRPSHDSIPFNHLEQIHLNGNLEDIPDNVTFSTTQYAERLTKPEPAYALFAAEMATHPVIFIGSQLDETSLWQHIEFRRGRGSRNNAELRPRSYLISPSLGRARRALLAEYNLVWLEMTTEQFFSEVIEKIEDSAKIGTSYLASISKVPSNKVVNLPIVSNLAKESSHSTKSSNYLLGQEPTWADIQSGRAANRDSDSEIWGNVQDVFNRSGTKGIITVTGTAGSGKSTSLMRLCLKLSSSGKDVGWIDADTELSPFDIRRAMNSSSAPPVLAIDDADIFGSELVSLLKEITTNNKNPLVIIGIRSGRVERFLSSHRLIGIPYVEFSTQILTDNDILELIKTLDAENRLGILKGRSRADQEKAFRDQAGRQLLVAMIQATSGLLFEEKVVDEYYELDVDSQFIYATIAVASAFRYILSQEEILMAYSTKNSPNIGLNTVKNLFSRGIIATTNSGNYRSRHRLLATILQDELIHQGLLYDILLGLSVVGATKLTQTRQSYPRLSRFMRQLYNHDFLGKSLGVEKARNLYGEIELLMHWDYHYWLQRGSLEVEEGDLALAENFINQAYSIAPNDRLVITERAYLLFRKASINPRNIESVNQINLAMTDLENLITSHGDLDHYPFHVLCSQGLSWSRRGILDMRERRDYLRYLISRAEIGIRKHPRVDALVQIRDDLKREEMALAISYPGI
jgi:SIR2-like domain